MVDRLGGGMVYFLTEYFSKRSVVAPWRVIMAVVMP